MFYDTESLYEFAAKENPSFAEHLAAIDRKLAEYQAAALPLLRTRAVLIEHLCHCWEIAVIARTQTIIRDPDRAGSPPAPSATQGERQGGPGEDGDQP